MSKSRRNDKELAKLSLDMALSLSGFAGDVAGINRSKLSRVNLSHLFCHSEPVRRGIHVRLQAHGSFALLWMTRLFSY